MLTVKLRRDDDPLKLAKQTVSLYSSFRLAEGAVKS